LSVPVGEDWLECRDMLEPILAAIGTTRPEQGL
jgi:hypothetical protein